MKDETIQNKRAFETFLKKGAKASDKVFSEIAASEGVTTQTIWNWYSRFQWRQRANERLAEIAAAMEEETNEELLRRRRLLDKLLDDFESRVESGEIRLSKVSELCQVLKLLSRTKTDDLAYNAISCLESLGFSRGEAKVAVTKALNSKPVLEAVVKCALNFIGGKA